MASFILRSINKYLPTFVSKKLSEELIKFVLVAIVNNVIVIIIFQILLFFINYKIASIIIYILVFFIMFFSNALYVFKNPKVNVYKGIKYAGFYVFLVVLNYSLLVFFSSGLNISPRISIFIVLCCTAFVSFLLSRRILGNQLP
jgi:putative flippase GtrA